MNLKTPLHKEEISKLEIGDIVHLTGTVVTARDKAHKRALEEESFPVEIRNGVLFHAGPIVRNKQDGWQIVAVGPTTSSRMNSLEPEFIKQFEISAIIGKGGMDSSVAEAMKGNCIYFAMTGGCAAITSKSIKKINDVHWLELGIPEAVWVLDVENLGPLVVGIDAKGNSLYKH